MTSIIRCTSLVISTETSLIHTGPHHNHHTGSTRFVTVLFFFFSHVSLRNDG